MIKTTIVCVGAMLAVTGLAIAQATIEPAPLTGWHFVGFSTSTVPGDVGALGMKAQCQADWSNSRICTLDEVKNSYWVSSEMSDDFAWVDVDDEKRNCRNFSILDGGASYDGTYIDKTGAPTVSRCDGIHHVACCQYGTIVPEPSQSSSVGSGLLLLSMLARRRARLRDWKIAKVRDEVRRHD